MKASGKLAYITMFLNAPIFKHHVGGNIFKHWKIICLLIIIKQYRFWYR